MATLARLWPFAAGLSGGAIWPLWLVCPRQETPPCPCPPASPRSSYPSRPLFCQRSWRHAEVLLIGAILAPGKRTVTSLLRIAG